MELKLDKKVITEINPNQIDAAGAGGEGGEVSITVSVTCSNAACTCVTCGPCQPGTFTGSPGQTFGGGS
ncbi:MAG: hypothetical protein OIF51_02880 [Cellvibrionaceae bacterium]|nr:hypothetical protein [Cellvibrionaceae bacterium]